MRRRQAPPGGRGVRVAEQIHHELAELIRAEVKDPRIGMVTVNKVDLSPDYAPATVWSPVLPDDPASAAQTLEGLQAAFIAWAAANPDRLNERAAEGVLRFAAATYPCAAPAPARRR